MENEKKLLIAAQKGDCETIRELLNIGTDPNSTSPTGRSPLHRASLGGFTKAAELLLEAGATLDLCDGWRQTPLIAASEHGHAEMVQLLLDAGADFSLTDTYGWTPFYAAVQNGHTKVAKILLDAGADPVIMNNMWSIVGYLSDQTGGLLDSYPQVPTLRTLCLRVVRKEQIDHQFIPPVVFEHPNEVEEERAYRKRRREFEENSPNKRT